jgi:hypothetical protein
MDLQHDARVAAELWERAVDSALQQLARVGDWEARRSARRMTLCIAVAAYAMVSVASGVLIACAAAR